MSTMSQWGDGLEEGQSPGTNRSAPVKDCKTCGGDRFVTVRLRSPEWTQWMNENQHPKGHQPHPHRSEFFEEVSPCPSCNADMVVEYWIPGHHFRSMDAAQTRQAMNQ
jgi:hypothetical protein